MPIYAVICFIFINQTFIESAGLFLSLIQIIILTILIPGAIFLFLKSIGLIDSMMADNLNQRKIPLAIQAILTVILIYECALINGMPELNFFFIGVLISTIIALLFLFLKMKISLHMMGLGGLLFFIIGISYYNQENSLTLIAFITAITGFTGTSRLDMNAHNLKELTIGFVVGVLPQILLWHFWL